MEYSSRIVAAFGFAYDLHRKQKRKGSEAPYITHLMGVAAIVGRHGGDETQFIAALLHDAVEDQGGKDTLDLIRERFGGKAARYVEACSDSDIVPKPPWLDRKERFIKKTASVSPEVKLIIAADKLDNCRTTISDLREKGNEVWTRFKADRNSVLWYYAEMVRALAVGWSHPALRELADAVDALHREAARLGEEGP